MILRRIFRIVYYLYRLFWYDDPFYERLNDAVYDNNQKNGSKARNHCMMK